jgi:hypothetical protein
MRGEQVLQATLGVELELLGRHGGLELGLAVETDLETRYWSSGNCLFIELREKLRNNLERVCLLRF